MHPLLLRLPTELLVEIIQLTRPDSYEAFMLTCKTVHRAGARLIQEHSLCKTLSFLPSAPGSPGHGIINGQFTFLHQLLEIPKFRQYWILEYMNNVEWYYESSPRDKSPPEVETLERIKSSAPWLFQRIRDVFKDLKDLDFHNDDFFLIGHNDYRMIDMGFETIFPSIIGLLMLPNLKSLIFDQFGATQIPAIVARYSGEVYFQQLQEICIKSAGNQKEDQTTLNYIAPLLLLPRLKSLTTYELDGYWIPFMQEENKETIRFEWPYGDRKSTVERICFQKADADIDSVANFLGGLTELRSFEWKNNPQWWIPKAEQEEYHRLEMIEQGMILDDESEAVLEHPAVEGESEGEFS